MTPLVEAFLWCGVQVTLFALLAVSVYLAVARWATGLGAAVLVDSLGIVGALTLLMLAPAPRWSWPSGLLSNGATADEPLPADGFAATPSNVVLGIEPVSPGGDLVEAEPVEEFLLPLPVDPEPLTLSADVESHFSQPVAERFSFDQLPWRRIVLTLAGVAIGIGLVRIALGLIALGRYRRSSVRLDDLQLFESAREISGRLGLQRAAAVCESAEVATPATIGWWRPIVLLPPDWRDWSPDQRDAVLAHELAHVRLGHFGQWLFSQAVLVPHYYHPLVHWLVRRLRLEQELAADFHAATVLGNQDKYAAALAALTLRSTATPLGGASLGLFMSQSLLTRRIKMLRNPSLSVRSRGRWARVAVLLVVATVGVAVSGIRGNRVAAQDAVESPAGEAESAEAKSAAAEAEAVLGNVRGVDLPETLKGAGELMELAGEMAAEIQDMDRLESFEAVSEQIQEILKKYESRLNEFTESRSGVDSKNAQNRENRLTTRAHVEALRKENQALRDQINALQERFQQERQQMMQVHELLSKSGEQSVDVQRYIAEMQKAKQAVELDARARMHKQLEALKAQIHDFDTRDFKSPEERKEFESARQVLEQQLRHLAIQQANAENEATRNRARDSRGPQNPMRILDREIRKTRTGEPTVQLSDSNNGRRLVIVTRDGAKGPTHQVTALFRVSRDATAGASNEARRFEIVQKTQLALLKSLFVLQVALRDPAVAALPPLASESDPITWLSNHLQVDFIDNSEILRLRMFCQEDETEHYRTILDAVAKAYNEQVVFAMRRQQLSKQDVLKKSFTKLNDEIRRKMEDYQQLAKDLGASEGESQLTQQLNMRRMDRLETEIMRLEDELAQHEAGGETGRDAQFKQKYLTARIEQLAQRRAELEEKMKSGMESSVDLKLRSRELDQLQEVAHEVAMQMERSDLQMNDPPKIQQIQGAQISRIEGADDAIQWDKLPRQNRR